MMPWWKMAGLIAGLLALGYGLQRLVLAGIDWMVERAQREPR